MLLGFILGGCVMTIPMWLFGAMFTVNMNGIKRVIVGTIIAMVFGFAISGLLTLEMMGNVEKWNDGKCSKCGTEYKLIDVEHHRNSGDSYYYQCENGHTIELTEFFEK